MPDMQNIHESAVEYDPQKRYAARQLSRFDVKVAGVIVFVVAMASSFVAALVLMVFRGEVLA